MERELLTLYQDKNSSNEQRERLQSKNVDAAMNNINKLEDYKRPYT